ncbi:Cupin 2 barrel domain-containing protein [Flavobacterium limnosediminis JC2902]|uniref:Cupin 2 barrel domain-containing protein n=1 Tax=Flavobacterium limnosediminis JC2902 TaxID=1341181 RepID=V6SI45_9FLAO|nr:hypothetical protein [Flavobacterium limnosediminis]ESU26368.1 Cupin 2 barrel domain-containing protein [Flavobacterium limnosediminis JC2902]
MNSSDVEKEKSHIIVEIIQYIPNAVLSKTIIKKTTGNITASSFDAGEELAEKHLRLTITSKLLTVQQKLE